MNLLLLQVAPAVVGSATACCWVLSLSQMHLRAKAILSSNGTTTEPATAAVSVGC
jgi:hypothetical protein